MPSVLFCALGKIGLCRVLVLMHSAKKVALGKSMFSGSVKLFKTLVFAVFVRLAHLIYMLIRLKGTGRIIQRSTILYLLTRLRRISHDVMK